MSQRCATLAAAAALALLAYRFCNLDLAPFILDEPVFLRAAAAEVASGHWLSASPIRGSTGVTYGPTVFWFYALVQTLFGSSPAAAILAMCVMVTVAHLALAWALADYFGGQRWLLAVMLAWIAASPYQFFWSRLAWDQSVDIAAAWVLVILTRRSPFTLTRGLLLGAVLGLGVSSHLMITPLLVVALVYVAAQRAWRPLAACLIFILAINIPYLRALLSQPVGTHVAPAIDLSLLGTHLLQPLRVSSLWEIRYFFDAQWSELATADRGIGTATAASLFVLTVLTCFGFCAALRHPTTRRFALFALVLWLFTTALHAVCHLEPQPHYMFASYWVVGVGLAAGLAALQQCPRAWAVGLAAFALVAIAQASFIVQWMSFIRAHQGTRGIHYGATLSAQTQLVRERCARGEIIANTIAPFSVSLEYIAEHEPACAGKAWRVLKDRQ